MIAFFITSGLIYRHAVKYSYLSKRFKKVVIAFGVAAAIVVIFSVYLVIKLFTASPSLSDVTIPDVSPVTNSSSSSSSGSSSDINF